MSKIDNKNIIEGIAHLELISDLKKSVYYDVIIKVLTQEKQRAIQGMINTKNKLNDVSEHYQLLTYSMDLITLELIEKVFKLFDNVDISLEKIKQERKKRNGRRE